jgi:hypothetical protein
LCVSATNNNNFWLAFCIIHSNYMQCFEYVLSLIM